MTDELQVGIDASSVLVPTDAPMQPHRDGRRPDLVALTPELLTDLVALHDAVALRVHQSPTLRLMLGPEVLRCLASVRMVYRSK